MCVAVVCGTGCAAVVDETLPTYTVKMGLVSQSGGSCLSVEIFILDVGNAYSHCSPVISKKVVEVSAHHGLLVSFVGISSVEIDCCVKEAR